MDVGRWGVDLRLRGELGVGRTVAEHPHGDPRPCRWVGARCPSGDGVPRCPPDVVRAGAGAVHADARADGNAVGDECPCSILQIQRYTPSPASL